MRSTKTLFALSFAAAAALLTCLPASAQIGRRFPSERKVIPDPVTGTPLVFLTSTQAGDVKIYPTHPQWTADGKWVVFRSARVARQAFAVNEETGDIVQLTETGYQGALCVAQKSMRLFFTRPTNHATRVEDALRMDRGEQPPAPNIPLEVVATDLEALFRDSAAGTMKPAASYEKVFGTIPVEIGGEGELALDASEDVVYFRIRPDAARKLLPEGTKIEPNFGARNAGAGPAGVAKMVLATGVVTPVVAVPFRVGHIQSNPWMPGEVVFCWETVGKAPQRTWTVMADGTGLRPLFPEQPFDWITHEAVVGKDEVALAILGHRKVGTNDAWGPSGTREHPTGLAIVNLRTREMSIVGQIKGGSGFWHVHASPDGRWAVGDDFDRNLWLIDRRTGETMLLSTGHKETAADHVHPTFNAASTKVNIQSAMLSADNRSMNICVIEVPKTWLERKYDEKTQPKR